VDVRFTATAARPPHAPPPFMHAHRLQTALSLPPASRHDLNHSRPNVRTPTCVSCSRSVPPQRPAATPSAPAPVTGTGTDTAAACPASHTQSACSDGHHQPPARTFPPLPQQDLCLHQARGTQTHPGHAQEPGAAGWVEWARGWGPSRPLLRCRRNQPGPPTLLKPGQEPHQAAAAAAWGGPWGELRPQRDADPAAAVLVHPWVPHAAPGPHLCHQQPGNGVVQESLEPCSAAHAFLVPRPPVRYVCVRVCMCVLTPLKTRHHVLNS